MLGFFHQACCPPKGLKLQGWWNRERFGGFRKALALERRVQSDEHLTAQSSQWRKL